MAGWIVPIEKAKPHHWAQARDAGVWAMTKRPSRGPIISGDLIFVWMSDAGLIACARAVEDGHVPTSKEFEDYPWSDKADGPFGGHRYTYGFGLQTLVELAAPIPMKWAQVKSHLGILPTMGLNTGPVLITDEQTGALATMFRPDLASSLGFPVEIIEPANYAASSKTAKTTSKIKLSPYEPTPKDESQSANEPSRQIDFDPEAIGAAKRRHDQVIAKLYSVLAREGIVGSAIEIGIDIPDLAWVVGNKLNVVEVKSLTSLNERNQLQRGLGQLLRYVYLANATGAYESVQGWLALESKPGDSDWEAICAELGINLWWPGAGLQVTS